MTIIKKHWGIENALQLYTEMEKIRTKELNKQDYEKLLNTNSTKTNRLASLGLPCGGRRNWRIKKN